MSDLDNDVMYKLGSIESMLKSLSEKMDKHIIDSTTNYKDHEKRITTLEKKDIKQSAVAGTIGALGAAAFELLKWITHN